MPAETGTSGGSFFVFSDSVGAQMTVQTLEPPTWSQPLPAAGQRVSGWDVHPFTSKSLIGIVLGDTRIPIKDC